MRRCSLAVIAALWVFPLSAQELAAPRLSPFEPASTGGVAVVDRALAKLSNHQRLLIVGAHPDDEDTTLLALVGIGMGGEAAYLSLSRGEGGQNLIGPELGLGLGLIRTGELLAARGVEGTRQYFTRAYDFGYTRSLEETFERWPRDVLLEDAVRAVRRFKPQVIVAIFPGNARAGHGQHQAAGVIAEEVFHRSGEPDLYPELTAAGLPPWQAKMLYRRVWRKSEEATLEFALDPIDPLTGRSMLQLAGASRSMHRSQDMGTLQSLGSRRGGLIWLSGEAANEPTAIFDGVDTDLMAIAELLPSASVRSLARARLREISSLATEARRSLAPMEASASAPALAQIVVGIDTLIEQIEGLESDTVRTVVTDLLREKLRIASVALAAAAGVAVDATAARETIALGDRIPVTTTLWNSRDSEVTVLQARLSCRPGWEASGATEVEPEANSGLQQWRFEVTALEEAGPSRPYFLAQRLDGDLYQWEVAPERDRGEPLGRPPLTAIFDLEVLGATIQIEREVVYRERSQADGEVRRPLRSVPRVEVSLEPAMLLWPLGGSGEREVEVVVRSHGQDPIAGRLELRSSAGWPAAGQRDIVITEAFGQQILRFIVGAADSHPHGRVDFTAIAVLNDGREFAASYPVISYPHIRPMTMPIAARLDIHRLDLDLPPVERLGYIRGASDRVPETLIEIGLPVELLDAAALRTADLGIYDAIVVGSRAYETDPVLAEANSRLIDYVRQGGLLLVQYQQYQFARGSYAPASLAIGRPHGRVTDETAAVIVLEPGHRVFRYPNRISEADWQNWVQERGLYFASEWDPVFEPLLSLRDDGRQEERGSLLVAEVGEGVYIYTGLSFFRQLPAGVPGAIRLFVNLLSREGS